MRAWLFIIALMLSPAMAQGAEKDRLCDITVMFGSYCCGTDHQTYQAVKSLLEDRKEFVSYRRIPWGKEGEFTLCVSAENAGEIKPLYERIKSILPSERNETRGYTTVRLQREMDSE